MLTEIPLPVLADGVRLARPKFDRIPTPNTLIFPKLINGFIRGGFITPPNITREWFVAKMLFEHGYWYSDFIST